MNIPFSLQKKELQSQHSFGGIELLPELRKTSSILYGIFVELLHQLYTNTANHPMGTPKRVWDPNPAKTEIWIDTELRWEDEHPEQRPAIYVKLSEIGYTSLVGRKDGLMGENLREAETYHTRSGSGTVSFVHVGQTSGEACMLADATMDYLDAFCCVIRCDFGFTTFSLVNRKALGLRPKESKDRYESVVTFEFSFQDTWTIKLESQRLKVFTLHAGQQVLNSGTV